MDPTDTIEIRQFPCRSDNFGVLVHDRQAGRTVAIDAPEEGPIRKVLDDEGWGLDDILITHHHRDHVDALVALKEAYGAKATGPAAEAGKIKGLDHTVSGGDSFKVGQLTFIVIDTPGHTLGSVSYHCPNASALFAADALFSLGCGRLFEGDPAMMWQSMQRLRALPDETMLYCGHEYTQTNARFALDVDPENPDLRRRADEVALLRERNQPTLPVPLQMEKLTNPFLRADNTDLQSAFGMEGASAVDVFAALRNKRDGY